MSKFWYGSQTLDREGLSCPELAPMGASEKAVQSLVFFEHRIFFIFFCKKTIKSPSRLLFLIIVVAMITERSRHHCGKLGRTHGVVSHSIYIFSIVHVNNDFAKCRPGPCSRAGLLSEPTPLHLFFTAASGRILRQPAISFFFVK